MSGGREENRWKLFTVSHNFFVRLKLVQSSLIKKKIKQNPTVNTWVLSVALISTPLPRVLRLSVGCFVSVWGASSRWALRLWNWPQPRLALPGQVVVSGRALPQASATHTGTLHTRAHSRTLTPRAAAVTEGQAHSAGWEEHWQGCQTVRWF